jgi:AcrR family transcriptional regulator
MSKGEHTRETILETALARASEVGLGGLSIGELAKDVGMSKSGLFAHFESKEHLELEILRRAAQVFIDKVMTPAIKAPRGEPRIRKFFELWLGWAKASDLPGGCVFIAAASELDDQPGPLRDYLVSTQKDWLGALAQAARIAIDEGHFRKDLDPDQFAWRMYSIPLAYHHFARLLRIPDAEQRAYQDFEDLLASARA